MIKLNVINNLNILQLDKPRTVKFLTEQVGSLGSPSKMPGYSYGIPAEKCKTGSKLAKIKGSVCYSCYALKGNYQFKSVKASQYKRLKSIKSKSWVAYMTALISKKVDPEDPYFRWHDAGDLQSVEHLTKICKIAENLPSINFWMPSREYKIVEKYIDAANKIPDNLVIRISAHMIDGKVPQIKDLPVSSVSTNDSIYPDANQCPARHQGNSCGDCRACWDPQVKHVSYHKH